MFDRNNLHAQRMEFIETISQEFLLVKGYGVYAYLSTNEVMRLFDHFLNTGMSCEAFVKQFVRSF